MRERGVDSIRGLAILGVIIYHAAVRATDPGPWWHLWSLGRLGVPVFFVVSGYLLALPWARHTFQRAAAPSLQTYLLRRVRRLEPSWLICFACYWLAVNPWDQRWLGEHVLPTVLYAHQWWVGGASPITPHSWSLEVEISWYLTAPLAVQLFWLPRWLRRSIMLGVMGLWSGWASHFAAGLLIADVRTADNLWCPSWVSGLALPLLVVAEAVGVPLTHWLTAVALLNPIRLGWAIERLGEYCYSLYLWHMLGQFYSGSSWSALWLNTSTGIMTGLLGYALVERPSRLRWG